jgi:LPS-assembly protein
MPCRFPPFHFARRRFSALLLLSAMTMPQWAMAQSREDETPLPELVAPQETSETQSDETPSNANEDKIDFAADGVTYESKDDIVSASGDVKLARDGYSLRADFVTWNRKTGIVTASGNVRSIGPSGDIAYGDRIELTDTLKDGMIENLLLVMADGGRLAAKGGGRKDGVLSLDYAAYSPCAVETPEGCPKKPSWQVKAVKVSYDPKRNRVKYQGARIELFGLPLIPLPLLSHPAQINSASGFLVPNIRVTPNNGIEVEQPYYWRLAPNRDVTGAVTLFTNAAPMLRGQFRTLEKNGAAQVTAYATYSNRVSTAPGTATGVNAFRGFIDGSARFQLDPNWSASASLRLASDRTFLRRYDISRDDRLRSTFNVERIDADSYFSLAGWAVQTLRVGDKQGAQPVALPEVDYRLRLDDPLLGGKIQIQANSLLIGRTSGQDTQRAFAKVEWNKRVLTGLGQEVNYTLLARGDVYNSDENDRTVTAIYRGQPGWRGRGILAGAVDLRWPFIGNTFGGTQILTPRVQFVAAPNVSNLELPNEDSRAVDLEDSNLFAINRFPGYDRFEDNYRITYGLDWAYRGNDINADVTIGQSYRLSDRASIFPDGTGLSDKVSDIVGRAEIRYKNFVKLTNRFRLDKDNFAIRRNEIDATIGSKETYAQIGYLRLDRNIGPTIEDLADREEIRLAGRIKVARYWSVFGSTIIDLTGASEDEFSISDGFDPIRHRLGIAYDDDCLSIGLTWRRDYQPTGDARRGNSYILRLAFRNLGV